MKTTYPSYYKSFKCIADKCKHSCCIGWEIDIDEDTLAYYRGLDGDIGERIKSSIEWTGTPHFKLSHGDRCPHLNCNGLCKIILSLGEDALCEICERHPRFYNYYENTVEIGIGLCCEEACRLVLSDGADFTLITEGEGDATDEEKLIFAERDRIFACLRDADMSFFDKVKTLLSSLGTEFETLSVKQWARFYLSLERLDEEWTNVLLSVESLGDTPLDSFLEHENDRQLQNLFAYFIYRYTPRALEDGDFSTTVKFAAISVLLLSAALSRGEYDLHELVRMYSSEVEYSSENLDEVYFELSF